MTKVIHIVLIIILILAAIWSIYIQNYYIFIANFCIVSAVLIDYKTTNMLTRENVNIKLVRKLQKIIPVFYAIAGGALLIWGLMKFYND